MSLPTTLARISFSPSNLNVSSACAVHPQTVASNGIVSARMCDVRQLITELRRERAAPPANCAYLRKESRTQPLAFVAVLIVQLRSVVPADCLHIDVDIARGCRTIVHVIGVLPVDSGVDNHARPVQNSRTPSPRFCAACRCYASRIPQAVRKDRRLIRRQSAVARPKGPRSLSSNQPQALHAGMPVLADDDVVVHRYAERSGDTDDRLGHLDIRLRSHAGGLELACALHLGVGLMIARAL
jgi:hypothetical protein